MTSRRLVLLGAFALFQAAPAMAHTALPPASPVAQSEEYAQICMGEIEAPDAERRSACDAALQVELGRADRADLLASRGWLEQGRGRRQAALRAFETALRINAGHLAALRGRAAVLSELGRHREAEAILASGLEAGQATASLLVDRANLRERRGDLAGARKDLDHGLRLDPSSAWARLARARLLQRIGEDEGALEDLDMALEIEPAVN